MRNAQSLCCKSKLLVIALASCFSAPITLANPVGPSVANGQATFRQQGSALTVTNSPGAIINWQAFSINRGEITRFVQQSPQSSVLNRVIGQDPSRILGTLQSNGRVFLINPNGIVFGHGARIDVAALVASSLKLSDADFLAGRMKFGDTPGAGAVINQGTITTPRGGEVYLIAPQVENSGIIVSPKGEVVLAAGKTVEIVDAGNPNLRVEIIAPDNQVVNLGQVIAQGGRVTLAGSAIRQAGVISADSAVAGENGRIVLKVTKKVTLEDGSRTTANGPSGGSVTAESDDTTLVAGTVEARGEAGAGGTVQMLGDKVGLIGSAVVDASGTSGGGTVLVGGDFQGKNPAVRNASATFFGGDAAISADAVQEGDGGRVIVWADGTTRAYGTISARGGAVAGDGGFVEVSGKRSLDYAARASIGAAHGRGGTLLLDPSAISLVAAGGTLDGELNGSADPSILFADGGANTTLSVSRLTSGFSAGDTITLQATGNITFGQAVTLQPGVNLGLAAGNQISITSPLDTSGGNLSLGAGAGSTLSAGVTANVLTATGGLTLSGGTLTLGAASTADNFSHSGGTLAGAGTLNVTGNMSALGGVLSGGNLAVQGTTTVSGLLFINNGATFTNSGTLVLQNSIDTSAGSGALINNGLIRNPSNAIHGLQTTTFVSNNGTLRNEGTGGLWLNGAGSYTFNGTTTLEGYGIQLRNATAAFIFPDGSVVNRTAFANPNGAAYLDSPFSANVQVGNATFNLPVSWFGGTVYNVGAGKTMTLNGGGFGSDLRLTGAGPTSHVALAAGQTLSTTGTAILSNLTFDNLGTVALADTFLNNGTVFNNGGTVNAAAGFISTNAGAGTFNNNGMLKNSGNSNIGISPSVFVSNNGTLRNEGTGSLALNGTGSYTFNGTTTLEGYGTQLRSGAASFVFPDGAVVNRTAFANANGMANLDAPFSPNVSVGNATFNLPVTWFGGTNYNVGAGKTMTLNGGGFGSDLRLTGAGPTSHVALAAGQTLATTGTAILSNLTFDNLGTVALADTFLNNGTVFNNGGTVNAAAGFISTNASAGTFNNNGMLKNSGNFNIGISPGVFVSNNGTLRNEGTGGLWLTGAGTFTFNGTTTLEGYGIQLRSGTFGFADGSVVNRTAFSNPNGAAYLDAPFSMLNFGDTTLNSYLGQFGGTVVNVGAGKMLTLNGGMSTGAINGAGLTSTVLVGSSLTVPAGGVTMNTLRFNTAGDLTIPAGETFTQNGGAFDWTGGALAGTGTLTVGGGATFNLVGGGARVLDGLTLNVSGLTLPGGSLTVQSGSLNAAGITSVAPGTLLDVTGGTFNAGGGTVNVNGTFRAGAGAISAGTMNVNAGGLLNGTGTVTGNVVNNGTVAPGSSPGILTVVGNYTQGAGGTLAVEIGGVVPGVDYDRLDVTGTANLAGTLNVSLFGGFVPLASDVFRVLTGGGGVAGTFAPVSSPAGYTPGVNYLPLAVDLGLAPIAAAAGDTGGFLFATEAQRNVLVGLDRATDSFAPLSRNFDSPGLLYCE